MSENCSFNETPSQSMTNENARNESLQTVENDMNPPPAQDSPQNIVNILNDDCLQLVLLKVKNVADFYSAAQVCTRFQANAKACFPFKEVCFIYRREYGGHNIVLFDFAEDFLSLFGPRIKLIYCNFRSRSKDIGEMDHDENLRLISQYCGQTLTKLKINGLNRDSNLNLRSPFQALNKLKLHGVSFVKFSTSLLFPELQSLEIANVNRPVEWLKNRFPMLQRIEIRYVDMFTDDIFIEFQNCNPQLQSLHLNDWVGSSSLVWENIGDRLPNIVDLSVSEIGSDIFHLSTLRHLRKLQLSNDINNIPSERKSFFSALVRNNQPIEKLEINRVDFELGRILQRLKTIKVLHIRTTPKDIVVDLVKHLPALEYLNTYSYDQSMRLITVRKILQNCKKMRKIKIFSYLIFDGTTDLTEHESIVALATGRIKLSFGYKAYYEVEVTTEYKEMLKNQFRDRNNKWVWFSG